MMAESRPPSIPFTLDHLPPSAWREIANSFDGDQTLFNTLAYHLGFLDRDTVYSIWNRGFNGSVNSGTYKLLDEFRRRGGTIQWLYRAFRIMDHTAMRILEKWLPEIHKTYLSSLQRDVPPPNYSSVQEGSCSCPSCNRCQFEFQTELQITTGNSPNSRRYPRQSSAQGLPQRPPSSTRNRAMSRSNSDPSNGYLEPNREPNGAAQDTQGGMFCPCDKCRLKSDPNETQLMTPYSQKNVDECLHSHESRVSSPTENEQSDRDPNDTFESSGGRPKICANSRNGVHNIGTRPRSCNVCGMVPHRHSWHSNDGDRSSSSLIDSASSLDSNLNARAGPAEVADNPINNLYSVPTIAGGNDFNRYNNITNSRSDNFSRTQSNSPPIGRSEHSEQGNSIGYSLNGQSARGTQNVSNQTVNGNLNISNQSTHSNSSLYNESANGNPQTNTPNTRRNQRLSSHPLNGNAIGDRNPNAEQQDKRPIVLITYSNHNTVHLGEIKQLIQLLQEANVRVKIDMDPGCFDELRLNRNEWLDRMVDNANHVIICISPTYSVDVGDVHDVNDPNPRVTQLNAKYIFDRLRTEYINNQSQNRRMIPVLFPTSGAVHPTHVPAIMQSTLVYSFPNQVRDIVARIVGGAQMALPYV